MFNWKKNALTGHRIPAGTRVTIKLKTDNFFSFIKEWGLNKQRYYYVEYTKDSVVHRIVVAGDCPGDCPRSHQRRKSSRQPMARSPSPSSRAVYIDEAVGELPRLDHNAGR